MTVIIKIIMKIKVCLHNSQRQTNRAEVVYEK